MKEVIVTIFYWILNLAIVVTALFYTVQVWREKRRAIYGIFLFVGGIAWHIYRGIREYRKGTCINNNSESHWLTVVNECIPHLELDVIWAQIAILTGLLVIIAVLAKKYNANN